MTQSLHYFEYDEEYGLLKEWVYRDGDPVSRGALRARCESPGPGSFEVQWFPWDIFEKRDKAVDVILRVLKTISADIDRDAARVKSAINLLTHGPEEDTMNAPQPHPLKE